MVCTGHRLINARMHGRVMHTKCVEFTIVYRNDVPDTCRHVGWTMHGCLAASNLPNCATWTSVLDFCTSIIYGFAAFFQHQVWSSAQLRLWSLGQLKTRGWERDGELFSPKKSFTVNSITLERLAVPGPYLRGRLGTSTRGPYLRGRSGRSTRTFPGGSTTPTPTSGPKILNNRVKRWVELWPTVDSAH